MVILPAIDLYDGNCVRLYRGDYSTSSKVADDALKAALSFKESGAKWLHLVDLNGAKGEAGVNAGIIENLITASGLSVEIGGGIRDFEAAKRYIGMGAKRIILGSAAVKDPALVERCVAELSPEAVAVGIDAREGYVSTDGWQKGSGVYFLELAEAMEKLGAKYIIFTDISRDGTLAGPNLDMLRQLSQSVKCHIIASGGIRDLGDILALKELGFYGAICGKSIYSGTLNLSEAIQAALR
jgi:phosphoribosylformimino-5-aminoimidazole carboxamide ribotide isomerase